MARVPTERWRAAKHESMSARSTAFRTLTADRAAVVAPLGYAVDHGQAPEAPPVGAKER